ncbi:hypothetical protein VDG1235_603 [Verrucomicrobiia bacterium DG1235]|nr:hypothetical protein VDG1235_603 [Verrucomicrobiae bacterium DG1235]
MSNEFLFIVLIVGVGLMLILRRRGLVKLEDAKEALKSGAVLIDVRTQQEYLGGNVPGAINIPLDRVVTSVSKTYPDKGTVLLCYCASGMRSGSAVRMLKDAGYSGARNVGSHLRATKLVS